MFPKRKSVCSQYHVNHLLNSKFYIARIFFLQEIESKHYIVHEEEQHQYIRPADGVLRHQSA